MGVGRSIIVACLNSNRSLASWQSIGESRFEWSARSPINCDADRRLREGLARRSRAKVSREGCPHRNVRTVASGSGS